MVTVNDTVNMVLPNLLPSYGVLGNRSYEFSNHLGNVLMVSSDIVYPISSGGSSIDGYQVGINQATDYSPFGVQLDGRTISNTLADNHRYGFQGQEKDNEIKGEGNSVNYEYRMHDPRLGRFFIIDPLSADFPYNSPYAFSENCVINSVELEGLELITVYKAKLTEKGEYQYKKTDEYVNKELQINLMKTLYFSKAGDVNLIKYTAIKRNGEIGGSLKYQNMSQVESQYDLWLDFFNSQSESVNQLKEWQIKAQNREASSAGLNSFYDRRILESRLYNNQFAVAKWTVKKLEANVHGNQGALNVAAVFDFLGTVTGYIPGAGQTTSTSLGVISAYMKSAVEYDEGNPNATRNSIVRAANVLGGELIGNKIDNYKHEIDKIRVLNDGQKSVINGAVGQGLGLIEDKLTE